jgi:MazG family protein
MLQSVFFAQMASEAGHFQIEDSLDAINDKLVRRHPHVFGDLEARTSDDVKRRWEAIKQEEKQAKREAPKLLLESVSRSTPALVEAQQISSRAAHAGFDWENVDQVLGKLEEELSELAGARAVGEHGHIEAEIGDILFVIVNIARFLRVDPEQALRKSNAKFRQRFAHVERELLERGKQLTDSNIAEMEELWQEAKRAE